MADVITRFRVDSSEYDSKIKRATEQLKAMTDQGKRTGASLEYATKEEVEFIRSLGKMDTVASSSKSQLRELTESILTLTASYQQLDELEKNSEGGKALAASIDQIKQRAASLQDQIGDLNEELRHMASDTSFTDGMSLMTRTVGSCAAAITAWTGESKTMDEMVKSLAKIGTTVAAVDALTKAFQKQNLVLLKNPYVLAAAGVTAFAIAMGKLYKQVTELTAAEKNLQEVQKTARENSARSITTIQTLSNILHDNTASIDDRREALKKIQSLVPDYHGALTDEGTLINDNTTAIDGYIEALKRAALAQAAFDKMVDLQKQKLNKQVELEGAQKELDRQKESAAQPVSSDQMIAQAGSGRSSMGAIAQTRETLVKAAQDNVDKLTGEVEDFNKQIEQLGKYVTAGDITTGGGSGKKPGGGPKVQTEEQLNSDKIVKLTEEYIKATDERREAIKEEIQTLQERNSEIQKLKDEAQGKVEVEIVAGSLEDLQNQLKQLQDERQKLKDPIDISIKDEEIDELQRKIDKLNGKDVTINVHVNQQGQNGFEQFQQSVRVQAADKAVSVDEQSLRSLMGVAVQHGIDNMDVDFRNLFEKIPEGVSNADWQVAQDKINEQLAAMGIDPIQLNFETGNLEEVKENLKSAFDEIREGLDKMSEGVNAISTLGNAFDDLKNIVGDLQDAFSGEMEAWDAMMTVFNSGIGVMQTVIGVMEAINTLQELGSALSQKRKADQIAETTTVVAGKAAEATAELTEAGASATSTGVTAGEASAKAADSVAGIPVVGPILAVAAAATVLAAIIASVATAKSSVGKFAEGGIIPGSSFTGDRLTANVNSGELILNRAQQDRIAGQLTAGSGMMGGAQASQPYVTGETIILGANNYLGRSGQGEIVTTGMLRRAGINL